MFKHRCRLNVSRENKLNKEHEFALGRLAECKRKILERIIEVQRQVLDFRLKDRMSEAEAYVEQLNEIGQKVEEFFEEVLFSVF